MADTGRWIEARYDGVCADKYCSTEFEQGDRVYIYNGKVFCEEHGEELES